MNPLFLLSLAAVWVVSVLSRDLRTTRYLSALGIWSVAYAASLLVTPLVLRAVVELSLLALWTVSAISPDRLHIAELTREERDIDALLRTSWDAAVQGRDAAQARERLRVVAETRRTSDDYWQVAIRLLERGAMGSVERADDDHLTPGRIYLRSARQYWESGIQRRRLAARSRPSVADEEAALRCYEELIDELVPVETLGATSSQGVNPEVAGRAEALVRELSRIPLAHSSALTARAALVDAERDVLSLASDADSDKARLRQIESATRMKVVWSRLREEATRQSE